MTARETRTRGKGAAANAAGWRIMAGALAVAGLSAAWAAPAAAQDEAWPPTDIEQKEYIDLPKTMISVGGEYAAGGNGQASTRALVQLRFPGLLEEEGRPGEFSRLFMLEADLAVAAGEDGGPLPAVRIRLSPYVTEQHSEVTPGDFGADDNRTYSRSRYADLEYRREELMGIDHSISVTVFSREDGGKADQVLIRTAFEALKYSFSRLSAGALGEATFDDQAIGLHEFLLAGVGVSLGGEMELGDSMELVITLIDFRAHVGFQRVHDQQSVLRDGWSVEGPAFGGAAFSEVALALEDPRGHGLRGKLFVRIGTEGKAVGTVRTLSEEERLESDRLREYHYGPVYRTYVQLGGEIHF